MRVHVCERALTQSRCHNRENTAMPRAHERSCPAGTHPLAQHTFVVVDVETTGLRSTDAITEVGAVRIVNGHVTDSFTQLVNPARPIPPAVTALTGITDTLVADAPPIKQVLEAFLHWARLESSILVAHNCAFDVGFLTRACRANAVTWPQVTVLDTLSMARTHLPRPLVPNHRLPTLANFFRVIVPQAHRALADAYTCAAVFTALADRLRIEASSQGQDFTFADLQVAATPAPYEYRHQLALTRQLPPTPGVYTFYSQTGVPLYVGSATHLRNRVRSYFGASETRERIRRMLTEIARIEVEPTPTVLDARILELRAIRLRQPVLNRSSRHQEDTVWVVAGPSGLETTHRVPVGGAGEALGPFRHSAGALRARAAIALALGADEFAAQHFASPTLQLPLDAARQALRGEGAFVVCRLRTIMAEHAREHRFEAAQRVKQLLASYEQGVRRQFATARVGSAARVIWARPLNEDDSCPSAAQWRVHLACFGQLLGSEVAVAFADLEAAARRLEQRCTGASARGQRASLRLETTYPSRPGSRAESGYLAGCSWEEVRELTRDLSHRETRLLAWDGPLPWACPVGTGIFSTKYTSAPARQQVRLQNDWQ